MHLNFHRTLLAVGLVALVVCNHVARADELDEIVTGCHFSNSEWGTEAIDRCVKDNLANRELVMQYPSQYKSIVSRCRMKNEYGWSYVKACIDKDIEAKALLEKYPAESAALVNMCKQEFAHRGALVVKTCADRAIETSKSSK